MVLRQSMNSGISGESPLRTMRPAGVSLRGSLPVASMRSEPTAPIGRHSLSQTVNRKLVSTLDFASVSFRAVAAIRTGSPV